MKRPEHIDPRWWYAATWHARDMAVRADTRRRREQEALNRAYDAPEPIVDEPPAALTRAELAERIDELIAGDHSAEDICRTLGLTAGAIEIRMRRHGRKDLRNLFMRVREGKRKKPCPGCGKAMHHNSGHCRSCAPQAQVAQRLETVA